MVRYIMRDSIGTFAWPVISSHTADRSADTVPWCCSLDIAVLAPRPETPASVEQNS
jgi:hypothetical protein